MVTRVRTWWSGLSFEDRTNIKFSIGFGALAGLLCALAVSCGPVKVPPTPVPPTPPNGCVAVHLHDGSADGPSVDAVVTVGSVTKPASGGYLYVYPTPVGPITIHVEKSGYDTVDQAYVAPVAADGACDVDVVLHQTFRPLPHLRVRGTFFEQETGARFTAIEASDFNLYGRFLNGEDIEPVLRQRAVAGFNLLRVWTRYSFNCGPGGADHTCGIGESTLAQHPDYYDRLQSFLRACARHGLYVELTAYIGPGGDFDRGHWDRLVAAVRSESNVLLELVNENDVHPIDLSPFQKPDGVLASHGSNGSQAIPPQPFWDYATFHTNAAPEEQRKVGHNAWELSSGPVLTNETSRYPDVGMWSGADLDRQKQLAYDSAAGAALLAAGSCFHSAAGKTSSLWDDATMAVAVAWAAGARAVPLSCQDGGYTRLDPGSFLRVYQRGSDPACVVRIRP